MTKYTLYKTRLEKYLQTEKGKRFINFAYSIGAAIVILGTMFKLLYLPYANIMLAVGLITEILVFTLSAFDRPVRDYNWEAVFPVLATGNPKDRPDFSTSANQPVDSGNNPPEQQTTTFSQPAANIIHREAPSTPSVPHTSTSIPEMEIPQNLSSHAEEYAKQMESLNRNLSGLNTIYEIQLKSISGQIDTIAQINNGLNRLKTMYTDTVPDGEIIKKETDKMAEQLRELNQVYARMLDAMTNSQQAPRNS